MSVQHQHVCETRPHNAVDQVAQNAAMVRFAPAALQADNASLVPLVHLYRVVRLGFAAPDLVRVVQVDYEGPPPCVENEVVHVVMVVIPVLLPALQAEQDSIRVVPPASHHGPIGMVEVSAQRKGRGRLRNEIRIVPAEGVSSGMAVVTVTEVIPEVFRPTSLIVS